MLDLQHPLQHNYLIDIDSKNFLATMIIEITYEYQQSNVHFWLLHNKNYQFLHLLLRWYSCSTTLSSTTFPHTCFFLAWGLTFILVPTRIIVHHRIILTVRIQIQPVPAVPILLHKPSQHRIVKPRPQKIVMIILAGFY